MDILMREKLRVINLALSVSSYCKLSEHDITITNISKECAKTDVEQVWHMKYEVVMNDTQEKRTIIIDPLALAQAKNCVEIK